MKKLLFFMLFLCGCGLQNHSAKEIARKAKSESEDTRIRQSQVEERMRKIEERQEVQQKIMVSFSLERSKLIEQDLADMKRKVSTCEARLNAVKGPMPKDPEDGSL